MVVVSPVKVASRYFADKILNTHYINLIDLLFIIGTAVIVINLFSSVILSERYLKEKDNTRRMDIILDWFAPVFTVIGLCGSVVYVF